MASGFSIASGLDLDSVLAPLPPGWTQVAATEFFDGSGNDLKLRYAPLSYGVAPSTTEFVTASAGDFAEIFAAFGSTNVQVATQPSAVSGSSAAGAPSGTVTSNTTTCAATRGNSANYSCTWHLATGSGVSFTNPNSFTTAVTGTVNANTTNSGTMYATLSDGVSSVNTSTVAWSLKNTSPAFVSAIHIHTFDDGPDTVPSGAANVLIQGWAGGAGGGGGATQTGYRNIASGGGGGGGYARSSYPCSGGQTINFSIGAGGAGGVTGLTIGIQGSPGGTTTISSGTLSIATMTCNGGIGGVAPNGGPGGSASGGTIANTTGNTGTNASGSVGGAGAVGITGTVSGDGSPYGGGGKGTNGATNGNNGLNGAAVFYYT